MPVVRLLLDTHVILAIANEEIASLPKTPRAAIEDSSNDLVLSVVSLWEIAIKHRQGRLLLPYPLEDWPTVLRTLGVHLEDLRAAHVIALPKPIPDTKDPFDRLLLAISSTEKMRLVTMDRALVDHPLAYR